MDSHKWRHLKKNWGTKEHPTITEQKDWYGATTSEDQATLDVLRK